MQANTHTYRDTQSYIHTYRTYINTDSKADNHILGQTAIEADKHTGIHTYRHTYSHTYIHAYIT